MTKEVTMESIKDQAARKAGVTITITVNGDKEVKEEAEIGVEVPKSHGSLRIEIQVVEDAKVEVDPVTHRTVRTGDATMEGEQRIKTLSKTRLSME